MKNSVKILLVIIAVFSAGFMYKASANENPLFVTITTHNCHTCKKLKPVIEELEYEYYGKIKFVTLDVSSKAALDEARRIAEKNGITKFFEANKYSVPKVGVFCPKGTKTENVFIGEIRKKVYVDALDYILFDTETICTL